MNVKKLEHDKNAQKTLETNTNDGDAEIFVLPPNLLEKLGIDLGNVRPAQDCPTDLVMTDTYVINKQPETCSDNDTVKTHNANNDEETSAEKETSILETANLMKKSVFLSPIFISTAENSLPGELEISNQNLQSENYNSAIKLSIEHHEICEDYVEQVVTNGFNNTIDKINTKLHVETSNAILPENRYVNNQIFYKSIDNVVTPVQQMDVDVSGNIITDILEIDEHPDEAYSSDYSGSNLEPIENINPLDIPKVHSFNSGKSNKEINILSEEILGPIQLEELKYLHTSRVSNILPINIKTFLSANKITENDDKTAGIEKIVPNNSNQTFLSILNDTPSDRSYQTNSEAALVLGNKGNMIPSTNFCDEVLLSDKQPVNISLDTDVQGKDFNVDYNSIISKDVQIAGSSSNANMSLINKSGTRNADGHSSDNSFGVCLDIVVTDIEKHLEDNVEVLDKFVNEINSYDENEILNEMESSEKEITNKSNSQKDTLLISTPVKTLTLSTSKTDFQNSLCDMAYITDNDCINKETILTCMDQNTVNNHFEGLPNSSKGVKIDGNMHVLNIQTENKVIVNNKGKAGNLNGSKNSTSTSIATRKSSDTETDYSLKFRSDNKQKKIMNGTQEDSEKYQTRNKDSLSHTAGNCRKKVKLNMTSSNNLDDKVEIIANYLSRYTHLKRKLKLRTYSTSKNVYINPSNHNTLKLCIEGVEKPGGPEKSEQNSKKSRVLKTYRNNNRRKLPCISTSPRGGPQVQAQMNSLENILNISSSICCSRNSKSEEFCLCGDFGRLAYYDCDSLYEHIHFWDHQNIFCNPETVFSIYDEHHQLYNENDDRFDENVINMTKKQLACVESTRIGRTICWNNLDRHHIMHKNLEIPSDKVAETLIPEAKECISNVDMLVDQNNDQHKDTMKFTNSPNLVKTKTKENISGTKFDFKIKEQYDTVQPKGLPNLVDTTMNKNASLTFVTDNLVRQHQNTTSDSLVKLVATSNKEGCLQFKDLPLSKDTPVTKVSCLTTMVVSENKEEHQEAVQVKNLLNTEEITSSVSTTMLDVKNTEQHVNISSLKHVIDLGNTGMETEESESDSRHNTVKTSEYSEPKEILADNQMSEEVIVDINASNVQTSDFNFKMPGEEIAEPESKKRGKKRKKSSRKQQNDNESLVKKTVKCGVCEELLVEAEWEKHIDQQHCFIAWKAGECIDFLNQELLKKLQQRLSIGCSLKCTFCDVEMKSKNKYLLHVQKCLKLKESSNILTTESAKEVTGSTLKCGVCEQVVIADLWIKHISEEHNYLAWKAGEPAMILDDEEAVRRHLSDIVKQFGELICRKCGLSRKYSRSYLQHVKNCTGNGDSFDNSTNYIDIAASTSSEDIKCGMCAQVISASNWMAHIAKEHDYLAQKDGEPPLDLNDEQQIRQHLHPIAKQFGGLNCSKCGLNRKYVKSYLQHFKNCNVEVVSNDNAKINNAADSSVILESNTSLNTSALDEKSIKTCIKSESAVKCGVCKKQVASEMWMTHIQKYHNYLAWRDGESLNIENPEDVQSHLYLISKEMGGLTCYKCGITRKYVKSYLTHIETCDAASRHDDDMEQGNITCGVCLEEVSSEAWKAHRMRKHYNVAWALGDAPIDIKNPYAVERFLKDYKDYAKQLVCDICGISRVSYMGFYAHVLVCGKTDEETEIHKGLCNICNKKYLCIYHNQHMAMHREQVYAKERKLKRESEESVNITVGMEVEPTSGRRRAAEKANIVIQNYKSTASQYQHICSTCGFGCDSNSEFASHSCEKTSGDFSDSDASVKIEGEESEDESLESDIDSDISDDENQVTRKRNKSYPTLASKVKRMPFTVKTPSTYLVKSGEEFCNFHFTDESLFVSWRTCEYEPVPDDQLQIYMPPLEQSCNVRVCDGVWNIYNRFEAKKDKVCSIFVGASIQCMSWAPPRIDEAECDNYLTVACHRGTDCPRFAPDEIQHHAGLIQIWDYGDFKQIPKFVFGLAHDFGTVWAMDWCPSGARDIPLESSEAGNTSRLGLLAVACSTGLAYIFSVPYPSTVTQSDQLFYKLKPVAELRVSMGAHRTSYQATALRWSPQKGHSFIVVGYGDGTTAYYDLNTDSPLLKTIENNVTILYPYYDERSHNSCVTGVDVYPSSARGGGAGAVCSSAPTGAGVAARAGGRAARLHSHLAASVIMFEPHWPSAILAGDDSIVSVSANEVEWWGGGRRFGPVRACCGCVRCARVALSTPPALRLARPHPAYTDRKKRTIGCLQMMQIGKKRKKLADDQLATKIEPLSYDEAVKKYGIELKLDKNFQVPSSKSRDQFPERFPLADVPSMAFCPTNMHHSKLAVATHAGVIFLITL